MNVREPIAIRRASIETMSVDIRVMRIDGKQMTLAVFRQLPVRRLPLDGDGSVWGWVDYHHDDCYALDQGAWTILPDGRTREDQGRTEHIHFVWSDGERLFKCTARDAPGVIDLYKDGYPQLFIAV